MQFPKIDGRPRSAQCGTICLHVSRPLRRERAGALTSSIVSAEDADGAVTRVKNYRRSILVVDDDPDIRETVSEILEDEGFEVTPAANGLDALELLRGGLTPALILLDIMMPVMDGRQFREHQLQSPELAGIPVIVFTAHSNIAEVERSTRPFGVLRKPLRLDELLTTITRVIDGDRPSTVVERVP